MPEEDPLAVGFASGTLADDDLRQLPVQRPFGEAPLVDMRTKRAELPRAALAPVVDHHFVHRVGERQLDRAHRSVGDDEGAGLDPARPKERLRALEARRLDHHVGAAQTLLPALGHAHRLPEAGLQTARERFAALGTPRMDPDLREVEEVVQQPDVPVGGAARPDVPKHPCLRPREMARAESRERSRSHIGQLRGGEDRDGHAGQHVVERQQPELGRQPEGVIVEVVADDLHPRKLERRDVAAEDVEMAAERGVGLEVDARLELRRAETLCAQPVLDGGEDLEIRQGKPAHVGLAEEDKLTRLHGGSRPQVLRLDGHALTIEDVARVARDGAPVELAPDAHARMASSRAVVERYLAEGLPAYGLTTGLGARVVERLSDDALAEFSLLTVLGRADSVGAPLPTDVVRAAMLVRANGLARAGAGARPEVAELLVALLDRGVHPVVPSVGSIGAGDITLLAHVALVLTGAGEAELKGEVHPGAGALAEAGLSPLALAPKDGLAVISSNAVSVAQAALALVDARAALTWAQAGAALSFEGFRASLSPLDPRVVDARPAPGQAACASELRRLLAAGSLARDGGRRLQDPLSFRCVSQVHGSLLTALALLAAALEPELNGSGDNPLVLEDEIVSTGNFFVPTLALVADAVALALAQVASLSAARVARLLSAPLTDLPQNLAPPGSTGTGMAPLLKITGALVGEIVHAASPVTLASLVHPDESVEDAATGAPLAARRLAGMLERVNLLSALELVVAAQAVDLAEVEQLGEGTRAIHAHVRELAEPLRSDRPLGADVGRVAAGLTSMPV